MAYRRPKHIVLEELKVNAKLGLDESRVDLHRSKYGINALEKGHKKTLWEMLYEQLKEPMVIVLFVAAAISVILKEPLDASIILLVVVINAVIGVAQESKAERALEALEKLSSPHAVVLRGGHIREIDASDLVVGDIVMLESGRQIPADLRLLETHTLKVDESALTGESVPVDKDAELVLHDANVAVGDRKNMAYMSTFVTYGRGSGIVVAVGMQTEIGKIATLMKEAKEELTPLQKNLASLSKLLGLICITICVLLFGISLIQKREIMEMLLTAISLAVAAIPEGLAAVVTIVLAMGVQRMSKKNAIIRKLHAVETLGCISVICSDKTGTLTQNKMTVVNIYENHQFVGEQGKASKLLIDGFLLCNDTVEEEGQLLGDPTETALVAYGHRLQCKKTELDMKYPRLGEIPFDSARKRMSTFHQYDKEKIIFVKGALDVLLPLCTKIRCKEAVMALTEDHRRKIQEASSSMAKAAQRVLALAYKPAAQLKQDAEEQLIFIGMAAMIDPPRLEVKPAIQQCIRSGIRPVMITGDHPDTAIAIGKQLGLISNDSECAIGTQIQGWTDSQLEHAVNKYSVFARVSPSHKVRLVQAFKANGHIVAMTGDGVNDAPSLKKADIGVSMGISGTDVCKQASDMILTDDNFASIVSAIEEGRNIYKNIAKTVLFLLSCNLGEVTTLFLSILFLPTMPSPLLPIQILWVNLVTDAFPALALGVDPKEPRSMEEPPRNPKESLFAHGGWWFLGFNGLLIGTISLVAYRIGLQYDIATGHTMSFMVLSISQLFHALNLRSRTTSIFRLGLFSNPYLILTLLVGIVIQFMVAQVSLFHTILKTASLNVMQWGIVFSLSLLVIVTNEISKLLGKEK